MRRRDLSGYGLQRHSEMEKHDGRALLFGTILILVHLLNVQPTEINAAGLKVVIEDVAVLRGALALLFAYFGYRAFLVRAEAHRHYPVYNLYADIRHEIMHTRRVNVKKKLGVAAVKEIVRFQFKVNDFLKFPFILGITAVVITAIVLACVDIYHFWGYMNPNYTWLLSIF